MELRVWIGTVQRIISGLSEDTTSQEVIVALAQATGKTGRFTLVEKWRDYEKTLTPNECPLLVAQKFGDYAHEVQFILRQTGQASAHNRRLIDAKSPKPQRRRAAVKKSMSFSGGAQSVSPSRSPKLLPVVGGIAEEDNCLSDPNYVTPQPRAIIPQPHPADRTQSIKDNIADSQVTIYTESPRDSPIPSDSSEQKTKQYYPSSSPQSNLRHEHHKRRKSKSRERSVEKRDARLRTERHQEREVELRLRETLELQQVITNHERRLEDEKRKLHHIDQDISTVTIEEEKKWGELYDFRDEISKALQTVQHLDIELEDFDEVLLSEELNVLLRKQQEMSEEMLDIQHHVEDCELHLSKEREQSEQLTIELEGITRENQNIDSEIKNNEEEMFRLQKRVEEKKRFLLEAEDGYMSACDDLKEADNSLEKRKQMLEELERELREYSLKTFINTGFSEKYSNSLVDTRRLKTEEADSTRGLLV